MSETVIALHGVKKSYQDTPVLDIARLELASGIYWLQGENGAGKTTCMKVMAGLIPFKGEIILQGAVSSRQHPVRFRRLINYAEAEPLYPAFLTGRDLLELYLNTKGGDRENIRQISEQLGVHNFVNNPVSSYSSGMLKKLSLLLAFTGNPVLILLDEPLITIDTQALEVLYELIRSFRKKGVTFCITSHQPLDNKALTITGTLNVAGKNITLN
ncbi:ABC transporter ATP-binding protein [Chitinophaga nivalis]|uniref:ABC transporter ATP-binding protein n=1 Tax=Chitinophaga nivalis TaxID=2991709 RepID=A0ABT3IRJ5_9BACT|nr:ABC transporter ATP-binding protein [Chitinophaga nivalis]MCW3463698.1 ABC transporter ATP-binding protein [Chitinophaga nivalis]MCW3486612.1 ABC transporter ATP-binding protein [Chitinophaga nivalis]